MTAACLTLMNAGLAMRLFHGGKRLPHFTSSEPDVLCWVHPDKGDLARPRRVPATSVLGCLDPWRDRLEKPGQALRCQRVTDHHSRRAGTLLQHREGVNVAPAPQGAKPN